MSIEGNPFTPNQERPTNIKSLLSKKEGLGNSDTLDAAGLKQVVGDWIVNEAEEKLARSQAEEALRKKAFAETEQPSEDLEPASNVLKTARAELKKAENELSLMSKLNIFGRLKLGVEIKRLKDKIARQTIRLALREKK